MFRRPLWHEAVSRLNEEIAPLGLLTHAGEIENGPNPMQAHGRGDMFSEATRLG